jgi:hypothetical protein
MNAKTEKMIGAIIFIAANLGVAGDATVMFLNHPYFYDHPYLLGGLIFMILGWATWGAPKFLEIIWEEINEDPTTRTR